jgi:hemerythrin-like domain-containing protein
MQPTEGQVAQMLHEEHVAVLELLSRLNGLLNRNALRAPPETKDPAIRQLLGQLAAAIETEINTHFEFEESALFPLLDANGEGEMRAMYIEDHRAIVPLGEKVAAMARAAGIQGFDLQNWAAFHPVAAEFADRLTRHAEAEEAALVPLLGEMLDPDEDDRLAQDYEAMR